jgi:hypothetical protein
VKAAQIPLKLGRRVSLENLLKVLDTPFANLHAAGNEAHFVLRAMLMLAVRDAEREGCVSSTESASLQAFYAVAQAPRPFTAAEKLAYSKQMSKERKELRRQTREKGSRLAPRIETVLAPDPETSR